MKKDSNPKGKKETRYPYQIGMRVSKEMLDFITKCAWDNDIGQAGAIRKIIGEEMKRSHVNKKHH